MFSLRILAIFAALAVLSTIYSTCAQATPAVQVHVTPRSAHQVKTQEAEVVSATDNDNGTITIYISACGAIIEVIATKETMKRNDGEEARLAAEKAIEKACK